MTDDDTADDMSQPEAVATASDSSGASEDRRSRVNRHAVWTGSNSLHRWYRHRHPLRVVRNYLVIVLCRHLPSLRLKRWLLRRIGVAVGPGVAWGLESTPDVFWPELVTVEENAIIGYDATILCHEFLQDEYRLGEVRIGERAMIGAGAIVLPGVEVGAEAQVAANSLVASDVPAGETVAGVPARPVSGEHVGGERGSSGVGRQTESDETDEGTENVDERPQKADEQAEEAVDGAEEAVEEAEEAVDGAEEAVDGAEDSGR